MADSTMVIQMADNQAIVKSSRIQRFPLHLFLVTTLHTFATVTSFQLKYIILGFLLILALSACTNDPCDDIICENGGTCLSGTCDCTATYEGAFCERQKVPTSLRLRHVVLTAFPALKLDGSTWDDSPSHHPDVLVELTELASGDTTLIFRSGAFLDADPESDYTFTPVRYIELTNPKAIHILRLFDWELEGGRTTPELMGILRFQLHTDKSGFPTNIQATDASDGINILLAVDYLF
jgi:hypothetical protein